MSSIFILRDRHLSAKHVELSEKQHFPFLPNFTLLRPPPLLLSRRRPAFSSPPPCSPCRWPPPTEPGKKPPAASQPSLQCPPGRQTNRTRGTRGTLKEICIGECHTSPISLSLSLSPLHVWPVEGRVYLYVEWLLFARDVKVRKDTDGVSVQRAWDGAAGKVGELENITAIVGGEGITESRRNGLSP